MNLTDHNKLLAHRKASIKYIQSEKGKNKRKRYARSKSGMKKIRIYHQSGKYKEKIRLHRQTREYREKEQKYKHSKKGKRAIAKVNARRRHNLGFIQMFPNPFDESIEYHHITDAIVVALPRDLHQLYGGEFHREKTMGIVKQIYLE